VSNASSSSASGRSARRSLGASAPASTSCWPICARTTRSGEDPL